jgi:serine/threonine protein phosphatase 1
MTLLMRTLAIGDIHGCLRALDGLLETIRPQSDDLVIALGDYVDRGPDSRGVVWRLLELRSRCRLITLRGNHDQMMLDARGDPAALHGWMLCGGRQALESYATGGGPGRLEDVPESHWRFLEETRPYFETETHLFVHGRVFPDLPLDEQPDYMLYWEKLDETADPHFSGKVMICGHTAQKSGCPRDLGHAVCIDTFVYGSGWLTGLDVGTGRYWQANQRGQTRTGRLGGSDDETE